MMTKKRLEQNDLEMLREAGEAGIVGGKTVLEAELS